MGNSIEKAELATPQIPDVTPQVSADEPPKKLKPCCACPETKRVRDECIIQNGEEHCRDLIEAHKECMRKLGFNI